MHCDHSLIKYHSKLSLAPLNGGKVTPPSTLPIPRYLFHYTLTQHAYTHQSTGVGELVGSDNVGMSEMTASPLTPPPSPEKEGTLRKEAGEEERNPGVSRHQLFMKCTTRIGNTFLLSNASGL